MTQPNEMQYKEIPAQLDLLRMQVKSIREQVQLLEAELVPVTIEVAETEAAKSPREPSSKSRVGSLLETVNIELSDELNNLVRIREGLAI